MRSTKHFLWVLLPAFAFAVEANAAPSAVDAAIYQLNHTGDQPAAPALSDSEQDRLFTVIDGGVNTSTESGHVIVDGVDLGSSAHTYKPTRTNQSSIENMKKSATLNASQEPASGSESKSETGLLDDVAHLFDTSDATPSTEAKPEAK